ncbi:hypothetical protein AAG570_000525 [Ranatra chinensis]|uniref:Uncharacterized protein n=1 Tax=Ranatra chinensis TaxID=642074 RepID=A0ABD0YXB0_9HEMI
MGSPDFDNCIKNALNEVRPFFKTGVPELNIPPFDPHLAKEVFQQRGGHLMNYKLWLKNVEEHGWTDSIVTKFRSNPTKRKVEYSQFFPEKFLRGEYEIDGHIMERKLKNKGFWNITLYDYIQTTTISRPNKSEKLKVNIEVQTIGNMDLHISNILGGRPVMESILDRLINRMWATGYPFVRPLINDLVSTAFTDIFNRAFNHLNLNEILPASK